MNHDIYDIAIVGAGVVGSAIAQRLAKYEVKTILLDKEADVAMGTSKANSGIIHQGYFTAKGSLKEILCLRGSELFNELCPQLDVPFKRTGALFCATTKNELKTLRGELQHSQERNVAVELIEDRKEIIKLEPLLKESVIGVLHFPKAGILIPWDLTIALAEHAIINGVELKLRFEVAFITKQDKLFTIHSSEGQKIQAKTIINAAGLYSDKIAKMIGDESFNIFPRRGEYIMFDKNSLPIQKILFPTPTVVSKGIVVGPTMHGNFYVGPNANEVDSKEGNNTSIKGLNEILTGGSKLVDLPLRKHITNFAGLRASTLRHDFIVETSKYDGQFIHAAGIDSPGLTSSLAIAERVEKILDEQCGYSFLKKSQYIPTLTSQIRMDDLNEEKLKSKIVENPQWGNIVCRCEMVSEAEIVEACHRQIPCTNTDMVKRRLRPGMGRCQGGFCQAKIMKIISRERDMLYEKVTKTGGKSYLVFDRTKNLGSEIFKGEHL
ncbi:MAG: NAD(P)/FAD-dependent oxidoreductase [Promethearchaeota archaeon]